MCKVLILLFIITFIKNPENAPNLLAVDHHLPLMIMSSQSELEKPLRFALLGKGN